MILILPIVVGSWGLFLVLLGFGICSQSLHESIHHKDYFLTGVQFRIIGSCIAIVGAFLI